MRTARAVFGIGLARFELKFGALEFQGYVGRSGEAPTHRADPCRHGRAALQKDPHDGGKTIIPDLAHSWQIAKDGKTYTFLLRDNVQFHDGAELTADDVTATFDRIVKPPQGIISIPRSILFKAVTRSTRATKTPSNSSYRNRAQSTS